MLSTLYTVLNCWLIRYPARNSSDCNAGGGIDVALKRNSRKIRADHSSPITLCESDLGSRRYVASPCVNMSIGAVCLSWLLNGHARCKSSPRFITVGVIWFRQAMKDTENTGMIPPYGSKTRTDEDEIYGELKAA